VNFESSSLLERIDEFAFSESGLKSMVIPARVSFIDGSAFIGVSLTSISISHDNVTFRLDRGFLETVNGSEIYRYFSVCDSVMIPLSVVILEKHSFALCQSLDSVLFEDNSRLQLIAESAFFCSRLKSIVIPSSVIALGKRSFIHSIWLELVIFERGSRLERIEESALSMTGLKSIVIPSSALVLGKSSFFLCKSLVSMCFESGSRLERIEESAFAQTGLTSIVIPASTAFVDRSAFRDTSVRFHCQWSCFK
jgi:hypothetical protein